MRLIKQLTLHGNFFFSALLFSPLVCGASTDEGLLYLTISVNGSPVTGLIPVKKQGERLSIMASDAQGIPIRTDDLPVSGEYIELQQKHGLSYRYDDLNQALLITADSTRLTGFQHLSARQDAQFIHEDQLSREVSGVALNYNLFASHNSDNQYLTAYSEFRTFGLSPGHFSSSFNSRFASQSYSGEDTGTTRLMTSWTWENIDKLLSLTVGDNYTASQTWSNSVRFGGISLTRNYTLQPSVNTSTRDILTDSVTMPSTVDLYIQGIRTSSQQVTPGQFTLNTAPVLSGNGSAQVVITDINGQQRVVDLALYGTNRLLTQGLHTWGLNAGWVRKDYSVRSFSYDTEFIGVGDWRYGATNQLTFESHTEQGANLNNLGAGANYLLSPTLGLVHLDLSWGRYRNDDGLQWGAGWQWNDRYFNVSLNHTQRERTFRDITALAATTLATRQDSAFLSWAFPSLGTLGASWINQQYTDQRSRYVGVSWSKSFSERVILATSFTQSLEEERDKTFYVNLTIPLFTSRDYLTLQHNHDNHSNSEQVSLSRSLESNRPGWGWNASVRNGQNDNQHASVQRRNTWSDMEAGINNYGQEANYYASMSGAVGLFMGGLYATRDLGEAFLLVDTEGVADIPVRLEHRLVGKTDSNGRLFLTNLLAYQKNNVDIDALNLPPDYRAPYTSQIAIPRRKGGALTTFEVYQTKAVLLLAYDAQGKPVPFSAQVQIKDSESHTPRRGTTETIVGYDGNIYLEDPPQKGKAIVSWASGQCQIRLPEAVGSQTIIKRKVLCQ